jgi:hypothetical protein
MGTEVDASCGCGLEATIMIGAGFSDFPDVCLFPALCNRCERAVETNLAHKPTLCPECGDTRVIPYSDIALAKKDGRSTIAAWGELNLTDGHHQCPACKQMTLRFLPTGLHWE